MANPNRDNHEMAMSKVASGEWHVDPSAGEVRGVKGIPFTRLNSGGYVQIKFRDPANWRIERAVLAHRVVWESVHGPIDDDKDVNHISGNKTDNRIYNLEVISHGDNVRHATATGLTPILRGEDDGTSKLTSTGALDVYRRAWSGEPQGRIASDYGVGCSVVSHVKHGREWGHVTMHQPATRTHPRP